MKKLAIFLVVVFLVSFVTAQHMPKDTLSRKEIRKKRKEARDAQLQKDFEATYQMVLDRSFVL